MTRRGIKKVLIILAILLFVPLIYNLENKNYDLDQMKAQLKSNIDYSKQDSFTLVNEIKKLASKINNSNMMIEIKKSFSDIKKDVKENYIIISSYLKKGIVKGTKSFNRGKEVIKDKARNMKDSFFEKESNEDK